MFFSVVNIRLILLSSLVLCNKRLIKLFCCWDIYGISIKEIKLGRLSILSTDLKLNVLLIKSTRYPLDMNLFLIMPKALWNYSADVLRLTLRNSAVISARFLDNVRNERVKW